MKAYIYLVSSVKLESSDFSHFTDSQLHHRHHDHASFTPVHASFLHLIFFYDFDTFFWAFRFWDALSHLICRPSSESFVLFFFVFVVFFCWKFVWRRRRCGPLLDLSFELFLALFFFLSLFFSTRSLLARRLASQTLSVVAPVQPSK